MSDRKVFKLKGSINKPKTKNIDENELFVWISERELEMIDEIRESTGYTTDEIIRDAIRMYDEYMRNGGVSDDFE